MRLSDSPWEKLGDKRFHLLYTKFLAKLQWYSFDCREILHEKSASFVFSIVRGDVVLNSF